MEKLITIILPNLNNAKYIEKCMRSVMNQTHSNLEILVIDAGSTDGSLEIMNKLADEDSRIIILRSDRKSYGYQVNLGVEKAKGEYIGVIETDDYVEPDMYERLIYELEKNDADYVKCQSESFCELVDGSLMTNEIKVFNEDDERINTLINPSKTPELQFRDRFIWLGLYSKELMRQIKLNETAGAAYQDIGFAFLLHRKAQRAVYISDKLHHYRIDNLNASTYNHNAFGFLLDEYAYCMDKEKNLSAEWIHYVCFKLLDQTVSRFWMMAKSGAFWRDKFDDICDIAGILKENVFNGNIDKEILPPEYRIYLELLFESPYALYGKLAYDIGVIRNSIKDFFEKIESDGVILFGLGKKSSYVHTIIKIYADVFHKKIVAYTDNNNKFWETFVRDLPVVSPDNAVMSYPDNTFVITSRKYGDEISKQLIKSGISKNRIVIFDIPEDINYFSVNII